MTNPIPYIAAGLLTAEFDISGYVSIEVRPVQHRGGAIEAMIRGDGEKADFWSVYLLNEAGYADCVADMPTEAGADHLAQAIMAAYSPRILRQPDSLRAPLLDWETMEAAQCLWEAVLDLMRDTNPDPSAPAWHAAARAAIEAHGYGEVRTWMRDLAGPCCVAYNRAAALHGYDDCFDWEWCPSFLASLDWSDPSAMPRVVTAAPTVAPVLGDKTPTELAGELAEVLERIVRASDEPNATAFAAALRDGGALLAQCGVSTEPETDEACRATNCTNRVDDGEGFDGLCGTCADRAAAE